MKPAVTLFLFLATSVFLLSGCLKDPCICNNGDYDQQERLLRVEVECDSCEAKYFRDRVDPEYLEFPLVRGIHTETVAVENCDRWYLVANPLRKDDTTRIRFYVDGELIRQEVAYYDGWGDTLPPNVHFIYIGISASDYESLCF